jgi:hypothetical protein
MRIPQSSDSMVRTPTRRCKSRHTFGLTTSASARRPTRRAARAPGPHGWGATALPPFRRVASSSRECTCSLRYVFFRDIQLDRDFRAGTPTSKGLEYSALFLAQRRCHPASLVRPSEVCPPRSAERNGSARRAARASMLRAEKPLSPAFSRLEGGVGACWRGKGDPPLGFPPLRWHYFPTRRCLMPVVFVILAFFVGAFLGLLTLALARAAHDGDELLRVAAGRRARRPVVDRRYIQLERARRHRLTSRAGWVGGSSSLASLSPH